MAFGKEGNNMKDRLTKLHSKWLDVNGLSFLLTTGNRTILCIALVIIYATGVYAAQPAPKAKQLNIGQLTYWSDIFNNTTARNWFANHNSWMVFDYGYANHVNIANTIAAMKTINPSFKAIKYSNFIVPCNKGGADYLPDTTDLKIHADSLGVNYDSLFLWTGPNVDDSVGLRYNANLGWGTTIPPNHKIVYNFANVMRVGLDFRNPNVGKVLGHYWRMIAAAYNSDGVMPDEECPMGYTGVMVSGDGTPWYTPGTLPFFSPKITGTYDNWRYNDATNGLQKPFSSSLTKAQIDDSIRRARDGWQKAAGDTLRAHNMEYAPNWSANGSPTGVSSGAWDYEVRHATVNNTGGAVLGEFCDYTPSVNPGPQGLNSETGLNRLVKACQDVKDSAVTLYIWPLRVGICDSVAYGSQAYMTRARSRLNGLGVMLECLRPGNSTYKFGAGPGNAAIVDNQFLLSHSICGTTVNDTIECWSEAWGKYFGYPAASTRRDTSTRGTDGAGQGYTIHKIALASQSSASDTLTMVIGRYARGANIGPTSAVNVTLPAGSWSVLNDNGTWTAASSPVSIRNAEWKVYSKNTALSDNGPGASSDQTPPSQIQDLSQIIKTMISGQGLI
jgi:hypothetical protein